MTRLRNQWASVFGYDPTAVSAPAFTLPASKFSGGPANAFTARSTSYVTATSNELVVSNVPDPIEWVELAHDGSDSFTTGVAPSCPLPHAWAWNSSTPWLIAFELQLIEVLYSAGSPTGVRIRCSVANQSGRSAVAVTISLANTWQSVLSHGPYPYEVFEAKARSTSTQVYLQFRITPNDISEVSGIAIPFNLRTFASKA
jgi:hypothetical protein